MRKRLLIVCSGGILSGKEVVSVTLAKELRETGWEVKFATSRWGGPGFPGLLAAEGFDPQQLWLGFLSLSPRWSQLRMTLEQLRKWPALLSGYRRLVREFRPDVVIHTNWHHALLMAPVLDTRRDVYWSHEIIPNKGHYGLVFRLIAGRVARMVCVSRAAANSLGDLHVRSDKLLVVHNGTSASCDAPGTPEIDRLRLGIVGQVSRHKGHEDLVAAIAELAQRGRKLTLRIFGRGPADFTEALKAQIAERRIEGMVEWCGFQSDKALIYSGIDVCVAPSRFEEPLATSALEAASCARPVICTSVGGFAEIVQHGETGLIVPPGQPGLLADAIEAFILDPASVPRMGNAARTRAETEFSAAAFGSRFSNLMQQMMSGHAAGVVS